MSKYTILKRNIIKLGLLTAVTVFGISLSAAEHSLIDHTIRWAGSTVVKSHTGLLTPSSFNAKISDSGEIESLKVILDMNSIDVTDLQGRSKTRLTDHLMSEDFFYVEKYPQAVFKMNEFKDDKMHGQITIRGISKSFSIPVDVTGNHEKGWKLSGKFTFNRQDFNVNYANAGIIGIAKDKIIRDDIELDIQISLK